MTIGAQFATRLELEAMRRKLERAISGAGISMHGVDVDSVENFIELADCPQTYAGDAGGFPSVNAAEDGLEFNPYIRGSATAPTLTIRNLTDAEVDPVVEFSLGATPVAKYAMGVDDSDADSIKLCIGSGLSDTHYGDTIWQYTPGSDYFAFFPETYVNNSFYAGYPDGTLTTPTEIELDAWSFSSDMTLAEVAIYPTGYIQVWVLDEVGDPGASLIDVSAQGRIQFSVWDPAGHSGDVLFSMFGQTYTGGQSEIWINVAETYLEGNLFFGRTGSSAKHSVLKFIEHNTGSDYEFVGIEAPDDITASYTLTLPATDSTWTRPLVSNGSGILSWANEYHYYDDLANDASITLPFSITSSARGFIAAGNNEERTDFWIDNDGDVTLVNNSTNVVANADTDDKFCIGTAAAQEPLQIKNRLNATKKIFLVIWYN